MKKGICFLMTAVVCAMLFTACGNNGRQSDNTNGKDQPESSSPVQSFQAEDKAENQDHGETTETEEQAAIPLRSFRWRNTRVKTWTGHRRAAG